MVTEAVTLTDEAIASLAGELVRRGRAMRGERLLVGIAGIPGSGKSTLAERLTAHMAEGAALVPMDGFHLTNAQLAAAGLAERKGAPETFDALRYIATLRRFRDPATTGAFPIYDRSLHEPVVPGDGPHLVTAQTHVILTEGNYLLLDERPWRALGEVLEETWWLGTPIERARRWIKQRHQAVGRSEAEAERRTGYDVGNMRRVLARMREPERVVCWCEGEGRGRG